MNPYFSVNIKLKKRNENHSLDADPSRFTGSQSKLKKRTFRPLHPEVKKIELANIPENLFKANRPKIDILNSFQFEHSLTPDLFQEPRKSGNLVYFRRLDKKRKKGSQVSFNSLPSLKRKVSNFRIGGYEKYYREDVSGVRGSWALDFSSDSFKRNSKNLKSRFNLK